MNKTQKKQGKRPASITASNKLRRMKARDKKALKRKGLAATKRTERRAFLKTKRLSDPNYTRAIPTAEKITHQALNTDSRGIGQLIYSCTSTPIQ